MASEPRNGVLAAGCVAALMGLSAAAMAAAPTVEAARWLTLCGLAAVPIGWTLRRCWGTGPGRVGAHTGRAAALAADAADQHAALDRPPDLIPAMTPDLTPDRRALLAAAPALEARLEHAPIALFSIAHAAGEGAVTPLNATARRLLAPGRASDPAAIRHLLAAQPSGGRALVSYDTERGTERALAAVTALTVQGDAQRLAALMPVESQLEAEALNAWRQLVQVLTHEIMNSLTPVASLSRTACDLLAEAQAGLPSDVHADLGTALDTIARRAASLVDFVASYRSLSTVPPAQPEPVAVRDLFARLSLLMAPALQARGGNVEFTVEPATLEVMADPGQLEQALINLLKNAAEATSATPQPQLLVSARLSRGGRLRIEVVDNGPGVPDDMAAHIFTPFFSSKKQGRGIGLAMVRHLVHANGGMVRYAKPVGAGARFVISF